MKRKVSGSRCQVSGKKFSRSEFPLNLEPGTWNLRASPGFTLVEMIVAVALFAIVMLVAVGALLSLTGANRKAQALQSVMNNLNIALDGMVRNVRMGTEYQCGGVNGNGYNDCVNGDTVFAFKPFCDADNPPPSDPGCAAVWIYRYEASGADGVCKTTDNQGGCIERSEDSGNDWVDLTAPEVTIENATFYVVGSQPGDDADNGGVPEQPKVLVVVEGEAGAATANTTFHIEATAVQRELDLNQN